MARTRESGFTLVELLIVVMLIGILAALSAPFLMAAKAAGNEASAIGSLRAVNSAQGSYATTCGGQYYAGAVPTLIIGGYVDFDVAMAPKSGYVISLAPGLGAVVGPNDCFGNPTVTAYYLTAARVDANAGKRGFATNQAGTIWEDRSGGVPTEPFTAGPLVNPIQ
jgi:type IV pilus assembly protein PilA